MFVCCECCVLSGRGLSDELITRPDESYRLWSVVVCDLETSRMSRPCPALGRSATGGGGSSGRCFFLILVGVPQEPPERGGPGPGWAPAAGGGGGLSGSSFSLSSWGIPLLNSMPKTLIKTTCKMTYCPHRQESHN